MRSEVDRYSGQDEDQRRWEEQERARRRAEEEREPPVQLGEDAGTAPTREEPTLP